MRKAVVMLVLVGGCATGAARHEGPQASYRLSQQEEAQLAAIADAMTGKGAAPTPGAAAPEASPEGKTQAHPRKEKAEKPEPLEAEVVSPSAPAGGAKSPVEVAAEQAKPAPLPKTDIREETFGRSPAMERPVTMVADRVPLGMVLQQLASSGGFQLELSRGVRTDAQVSVDLRDLPLEQAFHTVLEPIGYRLRLSDRGVKVVAVETRRVRLSFLNLLRSVGAHVGGETLGSIGQTTTTVGQTDTTAQTFGLNRFRGDVGARFEVDKVDPWGEIETALKAIVGEDGAFAANRTSGVVMVTGPPDLVDRAMDFLVAVDRELSKMVHLDVTLLEVRLTDRSRYGIDWNGVFNIAGEPGSGVRLGPSELLSGLANPLILTVKGRGIEVVAQALEDQGEVRVLSQPKLTVLNGQSALISVGEIVPFVASVDQTLTETQTLVTPRTATAQEGIVMAVTPSIGDDEVTLHLAPVVNEITAFKQFTVGPDISFENPEIANKSLNTMARVKHGEMVVMGGLISRDSVKRRTGIPVLMDIPLLGLLFSATDDAVEHRELVILIRPTIGTVPSPKELGFEKVTAP